MTKPHHVTAHGNCLSKMTQSQWSHCILRSKLQEIHLENIVYIFLAHLAQSAKVSFWDDPLSVVRRRRRLASCVVRCQQFT